MVGCHLGDLFYLVVKLTNITGVHSHRTAAGFNGGVHVFRLEVDIGNHRYIGLLGDNRQRLSILIGGARNTHNIAPGGGELGNLLQGRANIVGLGGGHGLHRDGRFGTDAHSTNLELAGFAARRKNLGCGLKYGHAEANRQGIPPKGLRWRWVRRSASYCATAARRFTNTDTLTA